MYRATIISMCSPCSQSLAPGSNRDVGAVNAPEALATVRVERETDEPSTGTPRPRDALPLPLLLLLLLLMLSLFELRAWVFMGAVEPGRGLSNTRMGRSKPEASSGRGPNRCSTINPTSFVRTSYACTISMRQCRYGNGLLKDILATLPIISKNSNKQRL